MSCPTPAKQPLDNHRSVDLVERIRQTIDRSIVVVADLTDFNPNVFLEVGYAWGKGIPTVLLIGKDQVGSLHFDVRTQTCLVYDTIQNLEHHLATALPPLLGT
jgi:nucleoside 2-deoxyribosyltransferase